MMQAPAYQPYVYDAYYRIFIRVAYSALSCSIWHSAIWICALHACTITPPALGAVVVCYGVRC